jgi:phage N-6-adenine-methyltransferase
MKRTAEEKRLRDQAATPAWLLDLMLLEFAPTLDVCASEKNASCSNFIDEETNSLVQNWRDFGGKNFCAWMNPPYSNPYPWCEKAYEETRAPGFRVVALLKLDPSTKWWREFVVKGCTEIRLLEKRIQFDAAEGITFSTNNFCNVLAIFEFSTTPPRITSWHPKTIQEQWEAKYEN